MASVNKNGKSKYWYVKDWDRTAGKSIWINTGILIEGDTDQETAKNKEKADKYLVSYLKREKARWDTQKQLRKNAKTKKSANLKEAASLFLKEKSQSAKLRSRSHSNYVKSLKTLCNHLGNEFKVGHITLKDLLSLRDKIALKRTKAGVDAIFRPIKAFVRWAYAEYDLPNLHKVILYLKELNLVEGPHKIRVVTDDEFKLVLRFVDDGTDFGILCKTYFKFARQTGRRLTEICKGYLRKVDSGFNWHFGAKRDQEQCIHLTPGLVEAWQLIQAYVPKDADGLVDQTNLDRFTNRISTAFRTAMRKVLLYQNEDYLAEIGMSREDLHLIGRHKTDRLARKLLHKQYAKMKGLTLKEMTEGQKRTAVKMLPSFKSLRHSAVTEVVIRKGIAYAKVWIGHSNIKTTEGYTHLKQAEVTCEWYSEKQVN